MSYKMGKCTFGKLSKDLPNSLISDGGPIKSGILFGFIKRKYWRNSAFVSISVSLKILSINEHQKLFKVMSYIVKNATFKKKVTPPSQYTQFKILENSFF